MFVWSSWWDKGTSLVRHFGPRGPLFPDRSTIAEAQQHHGFPWQQPLQKSLHKQHCWVSCVCTHCLQCNLCVCLIDGSVWLLTSFHSARCLMRYLLKACDISPSPLTPSTEPTRSQSPWNHSPMKVKTHMKKKEAKSDVNAVQTVKLAAN